jgi:hypothetical protein
MQIQIQVQIQIWNSAWIDNYLIKVGHDGWEISQE